MERSKEYALQRLDKWYADKFRESYTDEIASEWSDKVVGEFLALDMSDLEKLSIGAYMDEVMTRDAQIKIASSYFSVAYAQSEAVWGGESPPDVGVSKGVREEYIDPFYNHTKTLVGFVEGVRKEASESLDEISDEKIDRLFLDTFGDHNGFKEFTIESLEILKYMMDPAVSSGQLSKERADNASKLFDIVANNSDCVFEVLFGSLGKGQ